MKTLIRLLFFGLFCYGVFQIGKFTWRYYSFKDAVYSVTLHGAEATASELHKHILAIAEEHGIPLEWDAVEIGRDGDLTTVSFSYLEEVPITPFYAHPWTFEATTSARRMKPIRYDEIQ